MPRARRNQPKEEPHVSGRHVSVSIIDPRTGVPLPSFKGVDGQVYVEAKHGQPYAIKMRNLTNQSIVCTASVDGGYLMPKREVAISEVCSSLEEVEGGAQRETYRPLVFAPVCVVAKGRNQGGDATADDGDSVGAQEEGDDDTTQDRARKLGEVRVEVRQGIYDPIPGSAVPAVVNDEAMMMEVNETQGRKDLVFRSTTSLGMDKEVQVTEKEMSHWGPGGLLEILTLEYGTEGLLHLKGINTNLKRSATSAWGYDEDNLLREEEKKRGRASTEGCDKSAVSRREKKKEKKPFKFSFDAEMEQG